MIRHSPNHPLRPWGLALLLSQHKLSPSDSLGGLLLPALLISSITSLVSYCHCHHPPSPFISESCSLDFQKVVQVGESRRVVQTGGLQQFLSSLSPSIFWNSRQSCGQSSVEVAPLPPSLHYSCHCTAGNRWPWVHGGTAIGEAQTDLLMCHWSPCSTSENDRQHSKEIGSSNKNVWSLDYKAYSPFARETEMLPPCMEANALLEMKALCLRAPDLDQLEKSCCRGERV